MGDSQQTFVDNGDGTVTDNRQALMWQQEDDGTQRSYADAQEYCRSLSLGGHHDWRLPKVRELRGLVIPVSRFGTFCIRNRIPILRRVYFHRIPIDKQLFSNAKRDRYWTCTPYESNTIFTIDFGQPHGPEITYFEHYEYFVRAVRSLRPVPQMISIWRSTASSSRYLRWKSSTDGGIIFAREGGTLRDAVHEAIRRQISLEGADLAGADLARADLSRISLAYARLKGVDLSGANLTEVQFSKAGDSFSYADLSGAKLVGANLAGANFGGHLLEDIDLSGADLSGAYLGHVTFRRTNLKGCTTTKAVTKSADWNATICPDGTNSDDNGGTCEGHGFGFS